MPEETATHLSDAEARMISETLEAYRVSGLSTLPADRAASERIITRFYERIGKPAPRFVWLGSPLACVLACNLILQNDLQECEREREFKDWAGTLFLGLIGRHVGSQIREELRCKLWDALESAIGEYLQVVLDRAGLESGLEWQHGFQIPNEIGDCYGRWPRYSGTFYAVELHAALEEAASERTIDLGVLLDAHLSESGLRRFTLESMLGSQLWTGPWSQLGDRFWAELQSQLWSQTGIRVSIPADGQAMQPVGGVRGGDGQGWVGCYVASEHALGVVSSHYRELLAEWDALQRASGCWFPFERVVFCSERPLQIQLDDSRRLHGERGPAQEFRDGHAVYAWHGVGVPPEWIERRETLDPSIALTWPNIEQRRAAAEIVGWGKLIERLPTRVVNADRDPQIGTLIECELPDAGSSRFLRVRCATGREFVLSVPPEMTTARAANAWTYGLTSHEYQPEARS
ncbi:MAG TPA: hypothetical protein VK524_04290 [Polyangiaceae bacterium]|nr:hypothetical protein [Polyangiaceae bacterium]